MFFLYKKCFLFSKSGYDNFTIIVFSILIILLQSCGSGSNSNDVSLSITSSKLSVDAGLDISTYELSTVTLNSSITLAENTSVKKYEWTQIAGITTKLNATDILKPFFIAPKILQSEKLTYQLAITDSNSNQAIDQVTIIVNTFPIKSNAGVDQTVNELSNVFLDGNSSNTGNLDVSFMWTQIAGKTVTLIDEISPKLSFIAPATDKIQILKFQLTVTRNNLSSIDEVSVTVLDIPNEISKNVLLFTNDRINIIKQRIAQDDSTWNYLSNKISNYFDKIPYNSGEYAAAFSLAYYITKDPKYIMRATELLQYTYFNYPEVGWQYYNSRNLFRINARWAMMGYTWIKNYISVEEQTRIENIFKLWSEYWLLQIDYKNNFSNFRIEDTDNVTSLSENITLLGYVLSESTQHQALGEKLLDAGDKLLNNYVVSYYMNNIMAGGAWAEGNDYSPNTQRHWIRIFALNKDQRNIPFPTNYSHNAMQALIHQTLANYTSVYKYGSEESATDYESIGDDYRYEFALNLLGILENEQDKAELYHWFNTLLAKDGFKKGSMVTGFQRLMYYEPTFSSSFPTFPVSTFQYSSGIGLIASRSSWDPTAANLYFINRNVRVDQEHQDALSFDIAYKGQWITKEATGYAGIATKSIAHNTVLIENASDGSSSPTSRPAGSTKYNSMFDDESVSLISADATQAYNMGGYYATNYAKQVTRQLAFIKPNLVIIYDHIETDKTQINDLIAYSDLGLTEEMEHTRWVKLIQHVQAQPEQISPNSYKVIKANSELIYHVAYPDVVRIDIVDEKQLWDSELIYNLPDNQKKWHLQVSNIVPTEDNEFVTLLNFNAKLEGEALQPVMTSDYVMLTKKNLYIEDGNIIGIAVKKNQQTFIVLFKRQPDQPVGTYRLKIPMGYEEPIIYTVDFNGN